MIYSYALHIHLCTLSMQLSLDKKKRGKLLRVEINAFEAGERK